jgi:hypothetical protein
MLSLGMNSFSGNNILNCLSNITKLIYIKLGYIKSLEQFLTVDQS